MIPPILTAETANAKRPLRAVKNPNAKHHALQVAREEKMRLLEAEEVVEPIERGYGTCEGADERRKKESDG